MARKSRLLAIAASALAAGLALTGCAGSPGAAAVVDGEEISEGELATTADTLQPFLSNELAPSMMLGALIQAQVMLDVAAEHGVSVSVDEAREYLNSIAEQAQIEAPEEYPDGTLDITRMLLVQQRSQNSPDAQAIASEVAEQTAALDVQISPRYGTWDPDAEGGAQVVEQTPEWIIEPPDESTLPNAGSTP